MASLPKSPPPDLSAVRAVALDTSAFAHGQLNIDALGRLVKRAAAHGGVEVWVPEVALWEWAAHAAAARQTAFSALEAVRSTGLDVPSLPLMRKQEVLARIHAAVGALGQPLMLLPAATVAGDALRDQILVEGPAKTVSARDGRAIKTGAADSALLRSVLAAAGQDTESFALVCSDKDAQAAFEDWEMDPPPLFRDLSQASKAVFAAVPSDARIQASCLRLLAGTADEQELGELAGDIAADLYGYYEAEIASAESYADVGRQVVGLSDMEVDRPAAAAFGTAHILAAVTAAGVVQDSTGESTVTRSAEAVGASVRIPVSFDLNGDSAVIAAVETGGGVASTPAPDEYVSAEEAFQDLVECVRQLPGAASLEWHEPAETDDDGTRTVDLAGSDRLRLIFTGDTDEEWEVRAELAGTAVGVVGCRNLHDGFSDSEGFEFPDHYALWTDIDVGFSRHNPVWAINAGVLPPPEVDWHIAQDPHR